MNSFKEYALTEKLDDKISKGDTLISKQDVEVKVIAIKSDDYYSGDMIQIRVEIISGLNKGKKIWYDMKTLQNLYKKL